MMLSIRSLTRAFVAVALAAHFALAQELAVQRLELTGPSVVQPPDASAGSAIAWTNLEQDGAADDWILGETKIEVLPNGPQQVLAIHHPELARVVLPAPLKFRDTPRLTLDVIVRGKPLELRAQLMREGNVQRETNVRLETAAETQHIVLNFDPVPAGEMTCDRLALVFPPGPFPVGVVGIRIEDAALGGSIPPEAFGGVAMIELGSEARPGTCLSTQGDLRCEFPVENANQRLRFSYATPKSVMTGGAQPRLKLTLAAADGATQESSYSFLEKPGAQPTWRDSEVSLGEFVGKTVQATFHLEVGNSKATLAALGVPKLVSAQDAPRTVLLITADGHRADHISFLGGEGSPETKTLDALASQGIAFVDALSNSNGSLRSHQVLFTGKAFADFASAHERGTFLAERFGELGYATLACVGSGDLGDVRNGFDRFSAPRLDGRRSAADSIQQLDDWLSTAAGLPLFAWVHLSEARAPYDAPQSVLGRYYPDDIDPFDVTSPVSAFEFAPEWNPLIGDPFFTEALYDGSITHLDEQLTLLIGKPRFAKAVIAYAGSHGENLRNGGPHRFGHRNLSEWTLFVPLLIKAPSMAAKRIESPVSMSSLGRTLLHLAGHSDVPFPGVNLLEPETPKGASRYAVHGNADAIALVTPEWIARLQLRADADQPMHSFAIFRRNTDPYCLTDLAAVNSAKAAELRARLVLHLTQESAVAGDSGALRFDPACACENCESFR